MLRTKMNFTPLTVFCLLLIWVGISGAITMWAIDHVEQRVDANTEAIRAIYQDTHDNAPPVCLPPTGDTTP